MTQMMCVCVCVCGDPDPAAGISPNMPCSYELGSAIDMVQRLS